MADQTTGDSFVSLTITDGVSRLGMEQIGGMPWMSPGGKGGSSAPKDLKMVPYYFRANRGGKGQMRVGMKRAM